MSPKKIPICIGLVVLILCAVLPGQTAHAQEFPFIEVLYPQQGSPGTVVDLLLRGGGFESVQALNAVAVGGFEVPVLDYAILSDEAVEVRILIPEDMPVGETEITFVFDNFGEDAFFIVTEESPGEIGTQLTPREGQLGTEITLLLATDNFSLGPFGGVTIWGVELPVLEFEVNESADSWAFRVFLPPEIPTGEGEIRLYFDNYALSQPFFIFGAEFDQPLAPSVSGYAPNAGSRDSEIEMVLEGTAIFELGDLIGLTVAGVELPILAYQPETDEFAILRTYLPPELPLGETRIAFYYDFYGPFTDIFLVNPRNNEQEQPVLRTVSPREAERDSELLLRLGGENLEALGELVGVWVGDFGLPEADYEVLTSDSAVVYAYLPTDAPTGEQAITIGFENAEISADFFVSRTFRPDWRIIAIIGILGAVGAGVLVGGGILVVRALRGSRPSKPETDEPRSERQPRFDFKVEPDFGTQTIETSEESLTVDLSMRFEVSPDPGEQDIQTSGSSLVDED